MQRGQGRQCAAILDLRDEADRTFGGFRHVRHPEAADEAGVLEPQSEPERRVACGFRTRATARGTTAGSPTGAGFCSLRHAPSFNFIE
jgi:hypothetical protein